jgi:hypothetical protein
MDRACGLDFMTDNTFPCVNLWRGLSNGEAPLGFPGLKQPRAAES